MEYHQRCDRLRCRGDSLNRGLRACHHISKRRSSSGSAVSESQKQCSLDTAQTGSFPLRPIRRPECVQAVGHVLSIRLDNDLNSLASRKEKQIITDRSFLEQPSSKSLGSLSAATVTANSQTIELYCALLLRSLLRHNTVQHSTVQCDNGYFDPSYAPQAAFAFPSCAP